MKKNCHNSLLWQPFIRIVIKIIVAIVKAYHSNHLLSKRYSTFFLQVYLRVYKILFWIINVDFRKQTASDIASSQNPSEEIGIKQTEECLVL